MLTKILILLKLARKLALSDILNITDKFHKYQTIVKIFFKIFYFSLFNKNVVNFNMSDV